MNVLREIKNKVFKVIKVSFKISICSLLLHKIILTVNNDIAFVYTKFFFKSIDKLDEKYKNVLYTFLLSFNMFPKFPKNTELENILFDNSPELFGRKFKHPFSISCDIYSNVR